MVGTSHAALFGASFLFCLPVVRAEAEAGIIVAAAIAGLILLGGIIGVSIFCFKRHGGCEIGNEKPKKARRHKKHHHQHQANGVYPPKYPPQYPPQYHVNNGYTHESNGFVRPVPPEPVHRPQVRPAVYPTYHGPPPEFVSAQHARAGTLSGPPPTIVIPYDRGTVTMRPDPRPVIKTRQYKPKDAPRDESREERRHRSKSRDRSRDQQKQEFVIQQSYDGIPVIRPVVYIDDDRPKHRSKSKSRSKSRERPAHSSTNVITIPYETQTRTAEVHTSDREETPVTENQVSRQSKAPTPPPPIPIRSPERSRASSVTGALNALRRSTKGHVDDGSDSDSSKAPSFNWAANTERAPDPRAGDVMFFPAGTDQTTETNKQTDNKDQIYGYTTVIKQSMRESTKASVVIQEPERPSTSALQDTGYEVPRQVRDSVRQSGYETELSQTNRNYNSNDIGASMSDRLQNLVEDGDKTRFTRYNVGAVNFDEEKTEDEEPVQMRVRRPDTPPADFPRDSAYSNASARPETPPRDIPLITPRESTEIPPLDLQGSVNSPFSDFRRSLRPVTPPNDYPMSPTRPKTPPTDFHTPRPPTPPRDIETSRSAVGDNKLNYSFRSQPVDPNTGAPGSFQARQRFIEAHLIKNTSPDKPATDQPSRKPEVSRAVPSSVIEKPSVAPVHVPPGVVPPPPPPPPMPK